ncbi:hypothetical protein IQ229_15790 [Nostoc cf. edaphicum LEGE 07299]|uniref:Uncharacterized protein n=1 Tax=Nostoc cf. edaphicum LEGE 07299 TaxID=2777974 RepID=A0ABR9U109_9NOSO|nr:hypothetical protein [Nostoc edaphicum]MBE9106342.1 hypothetical protein [Nostoc cf. edaphicum LEGE 07299]
MTLAILCMVGYITLGQLAQLYWAMVVFGGLAGSFGLFYEFSCEKLADLNAIEDIYKLEKVIATSALAQDLLGKFAHRNPEITNQFPKKVISSITPDCLLCVLLIRASPNSF